MCSLLERGVFLRVCSILVVGFLSGSKGLYLLIVKGMFTVSMGVLTVRTRCVHYM